MGFYGPHVLVNDGKRHGVEVLPPDINLSGAGCSVEES
jgi:error-prone DNA polymerase